MACDGNSTKISKVEISCVRGRETNVFSFDSVASKQLQFS